MMSKKRSRGKKKTKKKRKKKSRRAVTHTAVECLLTCFRLQANSLSTVPRLKPQAQPNTGCAPLQSGIPRALIHSLFLAEAKKDTRLSGNLSQGPPHLPATPIAYGRPGTPNRSVRITSSSVLTQTDSSLAPT